MCRHSQDRMQSGSSKMERFRQGAVQQNSLIADADLIRIGVLAHRSADVVEPRYDIFGDGLRR